MRSNRPVGILIGALFLFLQPQEQNVVAASAGTFGESRNNKVVAIYWVDGDQPVIVPSTEKMQPLRLSQSVKLYNLGVPPPRTRHFGCNQQEKGFHPGHCVR